MSSGHQQYVESNAGASTSRLSVDKTVTPQVKMDASVPAQGTINDLADDSETDLITTIESDLSLLIQIMSSSIQYISNRSAHVQLSKEVPLYKPTGAGQMMASRLLVNEADMNESIEELSSDLVGKVKDMERLVGHLPKERDEDEYKEEMSKLQSQVAGVNEEYRAALGEASELKAELDSLLHDLCDNYQSTRAKLAEAVMQRNSSFPKQT